jgi:hypothetical protein
VLLLLVAPGSKQRQLRGSPSEQEGGPGGSCGSGSGGRGAGGRHRRRRPTAQTMHGRVLLLLARKRKQRECDRRGNAQRHLSNGRPPQIGWRAEEQGRAHRRSEGHSRRERMRRHLCRLASLAVLCGARARGRLFSIESVVKECNCGRGEWRAQGESEPVFESSAKRGRRREAEKSGARRRCASLASKSLLARSLLLAPSQAPTRERRAARLETPPPPTHTRLPLSRFIDTLLPPSHAGARD